MYNSTFVVLFKELFPSDFCPIQIDCHAEKCQILV